MGSNESPTRGRGALGSKFIAVVASLWIAACSAGETSGGGGSAGTQGGNLSLTGGSGLTALGPVGGPFSPSSGTFRIANNGDEALDWAAQESTPWLTIQPKQGTLAPGATADITASLQAGNAAGLSAGQYNGLILVSEVGGDSSLEAQATIVVVDAPSGGVFFFPDEPFTAQGGIGGPFSPSLKSYSVINGSDENLGWSVEFSEDWVFASETGGVIASENAQELDFELDDFILAGLDVGSYSAEATVRDTSDDSVIATVSIEVTVHDQLEGWTQFELGPGARVIYVSSSVGNDSNSGASQNAPKASLSAGVAALRDGVGDWLLLKRGDQFNSGFGTIKDLGGASVQHPLLIGAYGDVTLPRPLIRPPATSHGIQLAGISSHVALVDLEFRSRDANGVESMRGIYCRGDGRDLLIEGCLVEGFAHNVTVLGDGAFDDFRMRRTVVADSFNTDGQSQGLFIDEVDGVLIEECIFDHNGWSETVPGAPASVFNRNVYITSETTDVTWRSNISTNSSSDGVQMRAGGLVENSLFVANSTGFTFGLVQGGSTPVAGGVTGLVTGNVVLQSNDIETGGSEPLARGTGMAVANIAQARISNNVIAHVDSVGDFGNAISITGDIDDEVDSGVHDLVIEDNLIYDWPQSIQFENGQAGTELTDITVRRNDVQNPFPFSSGRGRVVRHNGNQLPAFSYADNTYFTVEDDDNWFRVGSDNMSVDEWVQMSHETGWDALPISTAFPDPQRDLGTYHDLVEGGSGGDLEDFLQEARQQRKGSWRPEYESRAVIDYIRAGFGLDALP